MTDPTFSAPPSRQIDGYTFELSPLPAWSALELSASIMKVGAPLIAAAAASGKNAALEQLGPALTQALTALPPPELVALSKRLLAPCVVTLPSGQRAELLRIMDLEFQGKTLTVFKVLGFALEVNYRDFFDGLQKLGGALTAKLKAAGIVPPSSSPPPSS